MTKIRWVCSAESKESVAWHLVGHFVAGRDQDGTLARVVPTAKLTDTCGKGSFELHHKREFWHHGEEEHELHVIIAGPLTEEFHKERHRDRLDRADRWGSHRTRIDELLPNSNPSAYLDRQVEYVKRLIRRNGQEIAHLVERLLSDGLIQGK